MLQAPTLAALAAHIRDGDRTRIPLRRYDDDAPTPLAPAQQRLWLLGRAEPGSAAYTVPVALHLTGDLDTAALAAAVADVAARHEILRTAYPDGVAAEVDPPVLEAVPGTDPAAAVAEVITAPFDLTADAPLRIRLIELGAHEWVLAAAVHHIAFDGGSVAPLLTDLQHAYAARLAGAEPIWWPLPVRYRDYARWQRDLLGDPADPDSLTARQLDHWATTLAGLPDTPLPLPTDRPRPARPSHRGGAVTAHLDAGTHRRVRDVARAHDATGFMVLHAALAALLARRSGRADIAVGTAVAGRADPRLHALVGMFVGTLTLRTTVAGDEPFGDLLRRIRTTDLDALAHADVPFDRVVARVAPVRGTHHPLFQVLLAHRTVPAGRTCRSCPACACANSMPAPRPRSSTSPGTSPNATAMAASTCASCTPPTCSTPPPRARCSTTTSRCSAPRSPTPAPPSATSLPPRRRRCPRPPRRRARCRSSWPPPPAPTPAPSPCGPGPSPGPTPGSPPAPTSSPGNCAPAA
ncbi:condensation domain-containing protein [Rhodococcus aetherivorans]